MTELDKGRRAIMRHAAWIKRNGYSPCGGQSFCKEGVKLTVMDNGQWYCKMTAGGQAACGQGRTPWSA